MPIPLKWEMPCASVPQEVGALFESGAWLLHVFCWVQHPDPEKPLRGTAISSAKENTKLYRNVFAVEPTSKNRWAMHHQPWFYIYIFFFAAAVVNCELGDVWSPIIVHTVNKLVVCKTSPGRRFIFAILPGHLNVASCFVVFFSYQQKERAGGRQGVCKSHPLSFFESNETTTSSMREESRSPRHETWSLVMPKVCARRPVSFKVFFSLKRSKETFSSWWISLAFTCYAAQCVKSIILLLSTHTKEVSEAIALFVQLVSTLQLSFEAQIAHRGA